MKAITMIMVIIALCISVHAASAELLISVEPANIEVSEGESFTVNIMVDPGGVEVMGVQYQLYFDNTLLSAVAQSKSTFLSHDGASTTNMPNRFNNTIGLIEYGETRRDVTYGVNTIGILAKIVFNATKPGVCSLTLGDVVISDPNAQEIPDVSINGGICTVRSTGTGTPTATQTATTQSSTGMATPTAAGAPTPAPTEPAATSTATAVETGAAGQTPPEPDSTASLLATPKQTMNRPSDNRISGFTSILAMIGVLIALYAIAKGKR
jgi:hypothetical protein